VRKRVDIDDKHSRAIVRKIGERLRESLKPEPELPERLQKQLDRLREVEERSPSIIPNALRKR
jgi:hypothetical protein